MMEIVVLVIGVLLLFAWKSAAPRIKGGVGESRAARELNKLKGDEYEVLHDVLLSTRRGSGQIDHIVVSTHGIFVIETKNYGGWIFGHENSEYWTQTIYKKKTKFRNPIKQNWAHIYALKETLSDFGHVKYNPVVVFAGRAELKGVSAETPVIYSHELLRTVTVQQGTPTLTVEQVHDVAARLRQTNIQDRPGRQAHVHHVRSSAHEREQRERSRLCPRCGGDLVARKGPYGKFYGCSNYPKCRYTRNR
jgi:hypothetical protein